MWFQPVDLISFWSSAWSIPLRAACPWLSEQARTRVLPKTPKPTWVGPLCIQRWIGQAVAARLAWQEYRAEALVYRFGGESKPSWTEYAVLPYDRRCLRELEEMNLRWLWGIEIERLLQIVETAPSDIGERAWTLAVLGACHHLAQLYAELKRRHKAMRARAIIHEELRLFVAWGQYYTILSSILLPGKSREASDVPSMR